MPRGRLRANYRVILKLNFTHVLPVSTWFLAFIPSWHPQWRCCKNKFCNTSIFFDVLFFENDVLFFENDGLFFKKRQVAFRKTTGHFLKTTGRFFTTDGSFFMNTWGVEKSHKRKHKRIPRISFVKIPIFTLPHARTRMRTLQEFSLFCCHKCHKIFTTYYFSEY